MKLFIYAACLLAMVVACGCETPAQIVWSPDGKLAAWRRDARLWVIDENGGIVKTFDRQTLGGAIWSADSRALGFAAVREADEVEPDFEVRHNWLQSSTENSAATQPASPETEGKTDWAVYFSHLDSLAPLFHFRASSVWHIALSPDEKWIAVVAWEEDPDHFELYVYSAVSRHLYPLAAASGLGMCFTAPNRLAYVELNDPAAEMDHQTGRIVEVTLDDAAQTLERKPLLEVLPGQTPWLAAIDTENIVFTSKPHAYPGPPADRNEYHLFHYSRADGALTAIAEDAGPFFLPSPDGTRILYQKLTPGTAGGSDTAELAVIDVNGSNGHVLRDLSDIGLPLWAGWRGNDQITFVSDPDQATPATQQSDENQRTMILDLVQYRLTSDGKLEALRTLSQDWPEEMKPYFGLRKLPTTTTAPSP